MELVAAVGGGVSGKVRLQLNKGRFLLSIQGSLVWGAGFKGYMTFEVGYESVVALLELIRKELLANNNEDPAWIDGEAMAYVRMLSLFGALAMDVPFIYARRYAFAKELYDKLTDGGRGAGIANTLVMDKNQEVMRNWVINLQPNAFGPLLMALSSAPGFLSDKEHLLQQQAIERCLGWIEPQPDAAQRFEDAVIRMNRDGARPPNAGQAYCENRLRLDSFMSEKVSGLVGANNQMRARYLQRVERLGGRLFGYCEYRTEPFGPALGGAETIKISYKGPTID
ncbi:MULTISPECIES: hypothetical protein [Pseudomonas]|nr:MULTISPECIES: hypothetical protein [Pseudomonas]